MKRGMKYAAILWGLALLLAALAPGRAEAAEMENAEVTVNLPAFKVTLNGVRMNNAYRQYPLIVYNDITYFPMTYQDCRFLGLETRWTDDLTGLFIETTGVTAAYNPYPAQTKNRDLLSAVTPYFPITVNGQALDNLTEEYPLLTLRDITYFPLTWRFAADEFGWEYSFDAADGLIINADNIRLEQSAALPEQGPHREVTYDYDGAFSSQAVVVGGYVYYEGTQGRIMQAELADTSRSRMVYQLPIDPAHDDHTYAFPTLCSEDGQALLRFHAGGATMGADFLIHLHADGTATEISRSRNITRTWGDRTFNFWAGPSPGTGNLLMKVGAGEYEPLGSPDYLYGWSWRVADGSAGGGGGDRLYLVGDHLYILAFDQAASYAALDAAKSAPAGGSHSGSHQITNGIYKVNIHTDEVTRVVEREVLYFQKEGDYFYYSSDGSMYRYSLRDGQEELWAALTQPPNAIYYFWVLNGHVYWQDVESRALYDLAGNELNPGAKLVGGYYDYNMALAGDDREYLVCCFEETAASRYRVMIFDRDGAVVFKTSDRAFVRNVTIEGKNLYFYNLTTGTVCRGVLP